MQILVPGYYEGRERWLQQTFKDSVASAAGPGQAVGLVLVAQSPMEHGTNEEVIGVALITPMGQRYTTM